MRNIKVRRKRKKRRRRVDGLFNWWISASSVNSLPGVCFLNYRNQSYGMIQIFLYSIAFSLILSLSLSLSLYLFLSVLLTHSRNHLHVNSIYVLACNVAANWDLFVGLHCAPLFLFSIWIAFCLFSFLQFFALQLHDIVKLVMCDVNTLRFQASCYCTYVNGSVDIDLNDTKLKRRCSECGKTDEVFKINKWKKKKNLDILVSNNHARIRNW
jgi:hypothetical protein